MHKPHLTTNLSADYKYFSAYYDVIKWKYFPRYCPFVPDKGTVTRTLTFLCCQFEQTIEQTLDWTVIPDFMTIIWRRRNATIVPFKDWD